MAATADYSFEVPDLSYWEPIYRYHDFYARLYSRAAIATFVVGALSLLLFPWVVSAILFTGGTFKTLLWHKHLRARRRIEARGLAGLPEARR